MLGQYASFAAQCKGVAQNGTAPGYGGVRGAVGVHAMRAGWIRWIMHVLTTRLLCPSPTAGKTLAFAIPVIEKILAGPKASGKPQCLVLAPTRELAKQVGGVV